MPSNTGTTPPTTVELMATLFGAATIVLGALAIVIAVLAIWGYHAIKDESASVAGHAAKKAVSEYLASEDVQGKLRDEIRKIIEEEMTKVREGQDLAGSQPPRERPRRGLKESRNRSRSAILKVRRAAHEGTAERHHRKVSAVRPR